MRSARSTRIALLALAALVVAAGSLVASACIDTTPITLPPKDAAFLGDASCTSCLELPHEQHGCLDILGNCRSDPACGEVLACIEALRCFDRSAIDDKLNCGVPCITEAGITIVQDPRVTALLEVVKCGQRECALACNLGDGGLGFDAL